MNTAQLTTRQQNIRLVNDFSGNGSGPENMGSGDGSTSSDRETLSDPIITYHQTTHISRIISPNLNVSRLVLELSLSNTLMPSVKSIMTM